MAIARKVAIGITSLVGATLWFWSGAKIILDLIGRALAAEDFSKPDGIIARGALWLFGTPWYVSAILAAAVNVGALTLLFLSLRHQPSAIARAPSAQPAPWPSDFRPIPVVGHIFRNEKVLLDGHAYSGCQFDNVTLAYNGSAPFQLANNRLTNILLTTDNPAVWGAIALLRAVGLMKREAKFENAPGSLIEPPVAESPTLAERFPTDDWDRPLDNIFGQIYMNETVVMDGRHFIKCTFDNVTYIYNGTRPTELTDCKILLRDGKSNVAVNTDNPLIGNVIQTLDALGLFKIKMDFTLFNKDHR